MPGDQDKHSAAAFLSWVSISTAVCFSSPAPYGFLQSRAKQNNSTACVHLSSGRIHPLLGLLNLIGSRCDWPLAIAYDDCVRPARCLCRSSDSEWVSVETTPQRPKILKPPPNHPTATKHLRLARTDFQSRLQSQYMFRAWTLQQPALRSSATHNRRQLDARDQNGCQPCQPAYQGTQGLCKHSLLSSSPSRIPVFLRSTALLLPPSLLGTPLSRL